MPDLEDVQQTLTPCRQVAIIYHPAGLVMLDTGTTNAVAAEAAAYIRPVSIVLTTDVNTNPGNVNINETAIFATTFSTYVELLAYLNGPFKTTYLLVGTFLIVADQLLYDNPENFASGLITLFYKQFGKQFDDQFN